MSELNWSFTYNTFDVCTRNSSKKASILVPDHSSRLEQSSDNPAIAAMHAETQVPMLAFATAYQAWIAVVGAYKGETNRFTTKIGELSNPKIQQWDIAIQNVFMPGSSDYIAIMPNGRKPFQSGAYDVRINEVGALAIRLLPYTTLAAVRTAVLAFYDELLSTRNVQQKFESAVKNKSGLLNVARIAIAVQMYKNLGLLMAEFCENPLEIERFFDLELIRSTSIETDDEIMEPTVGFVDVGEYKNIASNTFTPSSMVTITNTGTVPLVFYLAPAPFLDALLPTVGISLDPGLSVVHPMLDFGAIYTEFFNVKTTSPSIAGSYEVMIV